LEGVKELMAGEEVSVHAKRVRMRRKKICFARLLEGFGGCRYIEDEGMMLPLRTLDQAASDPVQRTHSLPACVNPRVIGQRAKEAVVQDILPN